MRSPLLTTITSANSTWFTNKACRPGLSGEAAASTPCAAPAAATAAPWEGSGRASSRARKSVPSTTVTMVSSRATSDSTLPVVSMKVKVSATGSGSPMPVDSISR